MDKLIQTRLFLEDVSRAVRVILMKRFPGLAGQEREDIEQEIKLKLWKMIRRGKEIRDLRSYLGRMVYTAALDVLAKRLSYVPLDDLSAVGRPEALADAEGPGPEALAEQGQMKERVRAAVEALPERRRAVLRLHFSGESIDGMAGRLGWSSHKVRHLLYRGLGDLRRKLMNGGR
jgi:RNA polymerase sigma factor (sigma-70 family)